MHSPDKWLNAATETATKYIFLTWTTLPIVFGFFSGSPGVDGLAVVFAPEELALIVHLIGFVAQKYEAIIVHTSLNVFGAWRW